MSDYDTRLIVDMPFGYDYSTPTPRYDSKLWEPTEKQKGEQAWVRQYLTECGCVTAHDIELLGCTGIMEHEILADGVSAADAVDHAVRFGTRLRLGLGGGGVGLPCFVRSDRFCLVHNTVGGLQDNQTPLHAACVDAISRELTLQESIQVGLTRKARNMRGGERTVDAMDILAGRKPEVLDEVIDGLHGDDDELVEADTLAPPPKSVRELRHEDDDGAFPIARLGAQRWECEEHVKIDWSCRHCLAQAVVAGALVPSYVLHVDTLSTVIRASIASPDSVYTPTELEVELALAEKKKFDAAYVYVLAATFERKLTRI